MIPQEDPVTIREPIDCPVLKALFSMGEYKGGDIYLVVNDGGQACYKYVYEGITVWPTSHFQVRCIAPTLALQRKDSSFPDTYQLLTPPQGFSENDPAQLLEHEDNPLPRTPKMPAHDPAFAD